MNRPRCTDTDYVDFLVATPRAVSGTEAARVQPRRPDAPAHDAFTRLLHRLEPDPATLWHEVAPLIERGRGVLIVDDTTLDKPYAKKIELMHRHWSGKHHAVVDGINLITLVWSEGESLIPCDWRVFDKPNDGMTKNDHFGAMVLTAGQRGFTPECVLFDSWYASIDNLRLIRNRDWRWLTQLRSNRLVNPDRTGNRAVRDCMIAETGTVVHLKDYGMVKVFRIVTPAGDTEYWATNDLEMDEGERLKYAEFAWGIEVYHRALKQECGVERAMVRAGRAQRNHIGCAIRAFVRLEWHRLRTGIGWKLAKEGIIRAALRRYLAHPWYILPASA
jgi:putative transposase